MTTAGVNRTIQAPVGAVWETLRGFDKIDTFIPAVASCRIEGEGVGAKRFCTLQDGMQLAERMESLDEAARTLSYSIEEGDSPFADYLATVKVNELPGGRCEVDWSSTFRASGAPEAELVEMVEGIYAAAIDGLEALHGGGSGAGNG